MNKVLVTGFEPFGGKKTNITKDAIDGIVNLENVHTEILPVEFGRAAATASALAEDGEFDSVLLLGERPSIRSTIGLETRAYNRSYAGVIPDNSGQRRFGSKLHSGAPRSLSTTMDYAKILASVEKDGLAIQTQRKIGRFVCNEVYYQLLYAQQFGELDPDMQVGFAHIGSRTDKYTARTALEQIAMSLRNDTL